MFDIMPRPSLTRRSPKTSEEHPKTSPMPLDVWKFVLNATRLRRRTPILRCASGEPRTHESLADAESEQLGTLNTSQKFLCRDGVNTIRLLQIARNSLLEDAKQWGGTALIDESWTCEIYRRKRNIYEVRIQYKAVMAKVCRKNPAQPVAAKEAKGIPGVMTIIESLDE